MTAALSNLRVDHLVEPLAVPSAEPSFSWELVSDVRGAAQAAYRLTVVAEAGPRAGETLWDTGLVESADTSGIRYRGPALPPASRFVWRVEARLGTGDVVDRTSVFETGPSGADWNAAGWIGRTRPLANPLDHHPAPYVRGSFTVDGAVARARVYATAGGLFDLWCNGRRVSTGDLAPGWTDYRYRTPFHAFDLTPHLDQGRNVLGAVLGEGWYSGYVGPFSKRGVWGEQPVFRAVCVVEFEDGRRQTVVTGGDWECSTGPILLAELLHGYRYDARLAVPDWSSDFGGWDPVRLLAGPAGRLVPARIPAAGPIREVRPVSITRTRTGSQLIDFGQNMAGRLRVDLTGAAGTIVRVRHAEILEDDGTLYTENLRTASATDEVILAGDGPETFEPIFTYHGFRYAEIDGAVAPLTEGDVVAVAVSSLPGTSLALRTDDDLLNRIQQNLEWTMLGNFIEVPTDCPNRDERLGWGGDAQMFAPAAMYNGDTQAFLTKWLDDIADAQKANGAFADIAPGGLVDFAEEGAAGYADAGVFLPWDMYLHYGDASILAAHYEGAKAWLRFIGAQNPDHVWRNDRNADYGDWLSTEASDKTLTATAYWAHAARTTAKYARVLGRHDEEAAHLALFELVAAAFRREFVEGDGTLRFPTQTALSLALTFGLLEAGREAPVREQLIADVDRRGHITTGFLGIRFVYGALSDAGRPDLAIRSLLRTERPSLGHQIARGLTTIGEHWSAWQEDGTLVDASMNSFNHFALASVFEWVYHSIGGVAPVEPGFSVMRVAPVTDSAIGESSLSFDSPRGPVACHWRRDGGALRLRLSIPANTSAIVDLPGGAVTESGVEIDEADGVRSVERLPGLTRITVGSGSYDFIAPEVHA